MKKLIYTMLALSACGESSPSVKSEAEFCSTAINRFEACFTPTWLEGDKEEALRLCQELLCRPPTQESFGLEYDVILDMTCNEYSPYFDAFIANSDQECL